MITGLEEFPIGQGQPDWFIIEHPKVEVESQGKKVNDHKHKYCLINL